MIQQLEKRLSSYIKKSEKNDKQYEKGEIQFKKYFETRFDIDKKIKAVYDLNDKKVREQEFSESQLDIWFGDTSQTV
jgi:hypothetical protein